MKALDTMTERRVVVYLGPSLSLQEARDSLDADYRPPIKRGDLEELLDAPPYAIGIVDGVFAQSLSISTKEILKLIDRGVIVYGSSSMGALRAIELHPYGMRGIGKVFDMYRSGQIDADDEVALTHDEDWNVLSEALVNIRFMLQGASEMGIISSFEKRFLLRSAKTLYFPERTYTRLLQISRKKLSETSIQRLMAYLQEYKPDVKRDDALLLLKNLKQTVFPLPSGA